MPEPRNPLRGEGQPREQTSADQFIKQRVTRNMRVHRPDGTIEEVPVSESSSCPDENGNYVDTETHDIVTDASGTVMPSDPARITAIFPFWVGHHNTRRSSGVYFQASSSQPVKNDKAGL